MELHQPEATSTRTSQTISRRSLLAAGAFLIGNRQVATGQNVRNADASRIIDIHQHTNYAGRDDATLITHQAKMGISKTVLLPAGSKYGLAANCGKNDSVFNLAKQYPDRFVFFANELPDIPETKSVIEQYLKLGAIGIGEQKFHVDCDSKPMRLIADIAKDHNVPVLMHFQYQTYNLAFERFYKMLEAYPTVNFIGHAQTWWANIDKNCRQEVMYPKGPVTPGGITDRLLSDYPISLAICRQDRA